MIRGTPFAVVSPVINKVITALTVRDDVLLIKREKARAFFFYTGESDQMLGEMNRYLFKTLGPVYVYAVYGLYNGMVDLTPYLESEVKDRHPYYNREKKDLSDTELSAFLAEKTV